MRNQRLRRFLFFLPLRLGVFIFAILTARSEDLNRNSPLHILVSILLFLAPLVEDRTLMVPWLMVYGAEFVYLFPWDCCYDLCSSWNYWREAILGYGILVVSSYYLLLKDMEENGPVDLGDHWIPGLDVFGDLSAGGGGSFGGSIGGEGEVGVDVGGSVHADVNADLDVQAGANVDADMCLDPSGSAAAGGSYGVGCEEFVNDGSQLPPDDPCVEALRVSTGSQHRTSVRASQRASQRTSQKVSQRGSQGASSQAKTSSRICPEFPPECIPQPLPDYCYELRNQLAAPQGSQVRSSVKSSQQCQTKRSSLKKSKREMSECEVDTATEEQQPPEEEGGAAEFYGEERPPECPPCPPCPGEEGSRTTRSSRGSRGSRGASSRGASRGPSRGPSARGSTGARITGQVTGTGALRVSGSQRNKSSDPCRRQSGADGWYEPSIDAHVRGPMLRSGNSVTYGLPRRSGGGGMPFGANYNNVYMHEQYAMMTTATPMPHGAMKQQPQMMQRRVPECGEAKVWRSTCFVLGKGVKLLLGAVAYVLDNAFDTGEYQQALYSSSLASSRNNNAPAQVNQRQLQLQQQQRARSMRAIRAM